MPQNEAKKNLFERKRHSYMMKIKTPKDSDLAQVLSFDAYQSKKMSVIATSKVSTHKS